MKIGVISDTHDRLDAIERAVEVFNNERVDVVIHAGDFVSPFTEKPFRALNAKFYGIFGNNDGDKLLLKEKYRRVGEIEEDPLELEIQSVSIAVTHRPKIVNALSHIYDIVIFGHTHMPEIRTGERKTGSGAETLVINPGECCGYLSGRQTVAIIDIDSFSADILEI